MLITYNLTWYWSFRNICDDLLEQKTSDNLIFIFLNKEMWRCPRDNENVIYFYSIFQNVTDLLDNNVTCQKCDILKIHLT